MVKQVILAVSTWSGIKMQLGGYKDMKNTYIKIIAEGHLGLSQIHKFKGIEVKNPINIE